MLPHMAFDIQVEIMKRLPVKSLIQFRSVCKAWKSFIDSSQFIAGYKTQSQHLMIRYTVGHGEEKQVKYVSYVDDDSFPQQNLTVPPLVQLTTGIVGSSHGLLCLTGYFGDNTPMVVLWNPAIRKSIAVAVPNVVGPPFNSVFGFGVCPDTKDPKLVKITCIYDIRKIESISCIPYQVMVFTLSSGEWTCLFSNHQLPRKSIQFTCSSTVIGQFIYWIAYDRINVNGGSCNLLMSFDMATQEFREVDLPGYLAEKPKFFDLSIFRLRESLAVVEYGWKGFRNVWMMEHGDSRAFTKLFTINAPNASISRPLEFMKSGEPIYEIVQRDNICTLVVYEPCSKHIMDLGIHGNKYLSFASFYTESLLLLDYDKDDIVRCGAMKT